MHIPDNYLSVSTCAVLTAALVPVWAHSIKKVTKDFPRERFSALGVAAAFSFLAMMFNIPLPGGTTGHAVGGVVLAVLLGPEAACLSVTIALLIQALLFGDGGILAFGANAFNIAFIMPFSGYYAFIFLRKLFGGMSKKTSGSGVSLSDYAALAIASYVGLNLAALATAVQFGIQPLLFTDESGQALYCPYPLSVALPAMAIGHLTIFGAAEAIFSVAVYAFVAKTAPSFAANESVLVPKLSEDASEAEPLSEDAPESESKPSSRWGAIYLLLALLIAATPLGLLAEGTAWGEWGAEEIAETIEVDGQALGYVPSAMENGFQWSAPIPDYAASGLPDWLAYVLSAIAGVAASIILFKLASAFMKDRSPV